MTEYQPQQDSESNHSIAEESKHDRHHSFADVDLTTDMIRDDGDDQPKNGQDNTMDLDTMSDELTTVVVQMPAHQQGVWHAICTFDKHQRLNFVLNCGLIIGSVLAFLTRITTALVLFIKYRKGLEGVLPMMCSVFPLFTCILGLLGCCAMVRNSASLMRIHSYGLGVTSVYMTVTSVILSIVTFMLGSYFDFVVNLGAFMTYSWGFFTLCFMSSYVVRNMNRKMESSKETLKMKNKKQAHHMKNSYDGSASRIELRISPESDE